MHKNDDALIWAALGNKGSGGAGGGGIKDVVVNGESVVTDGVAEIDLADYAENLTDLDTRVTELEEHGGGGGTPSLTDDGILIF